MDGELIIQANGLEMLVTSDGQTDALNFSIRATNESKENKADKENNENNENEIDLDVDEINFIGDVFNELLSKLQSKKLNLSCGEVFETENFEVCIRRKTENGFE